MPFDVFVLDVYPDGLVAVGKLRRGSQLVRCWEMANRYALKNVNRVYVLGRDMRELVKTKYTASQKEVVYLPHWSPIAPMRIRLAEESRMWKQLSLEGKFVVQYSGNMGLWHDIETIVLAADELKEENRIRFLMIGEGIRKGPAKLLYERLGLSNMLWWPYQDRKDLEDSLACCHAALVSQRAGTEGIAVPCKLYGILASGRAIILQAPTLSEAALVVREEGCGVNVPLGDAKALAACIREMADDETWTKSLGEHAFAAYLTKYSISVAIDRCYDAFNSR
jgi:glycosyltransferase involved in cell wall biosynthesis